MFWRRALVLHSAMYPCGVPGDEGKPSQRLHSKVAKRSVEHSARSSAVAKRSDRWPFGSSSQQRKRARERPRCARARATELPKRSGRFMKGRLAFRWVSWQFSSACAAFTTNTAKKPHLEDDENYWWEGCPPLPARPHTLSVFTVLLLPLLPRAHTLGQNGRKN